MTVLLAFQVWSLHALSLIIDAFGPMFRTYVENTLQVVLALYLQVAPHHCQVHRCLGKCLGALITTMGPELQGISSFDFAVAGDAVFQSDEARGSSFLRVASNFDFALMKQRDT